MGVALNGDVISKNWSNNNVKSNLFILKSIIVNLMNRFNISHSEEISNSGNLQIKVVDKVIATIEQISINDLKEFGIKSDVYFSNVDLDLFYSLINDDFFNVKPISKFPIVVRDFSFLIDDDILYRDIKSTVMSVSPKLINGVSLIDSYKSDNTKNKISYSFSVSLSSKEKTLSDKEIKSISEKIIKSVSKKHDAVIRDQ